MTMEQHKGHTLYWLLKSEPKCWSWHDQTTQQTTNWDGVRNYQATNAMKRMQLNDQAFFYHSVTDKCIMGIVRICKVYHPDPSDETGKFGMVDVCYDRPLPQPVALQIIKNDERLQHLALLRQSQLSVMPIDESSWKIICTLGGL